MSRPHPETCVLLVDNGSLEPAAVLRLRALADALGGRLGRTVEPVSILHADRVPAAQLGGRAAEVLEPALRRRLEAGVSDFVLVPLFIGPTRALSEFVPLAVERLRPEFPAFKLRVAEPLHGAGDDLLARILADQSMVVLPVDSATAGKVRVAVVDHGSPVRAVAAVRDQVAAQLAVRLRGRVAEVAPCSMERRPGSEYDFNEPLLGHLLATAPWNQGQVVVAHLFLLPGRHAGPGGDIAQICQAAEKASGGNLRITRTGLLGDHPLLLDVLHDRARSAGL
jgi:sirohydrochlorin ferrochelatase